MPLRTAFDALVLLQRLLQRSPWLAHQMVLEHLAVAPMKIVKPESLVFEVFRNAIFVEASNVGWQIKVVMSRYGGSFLESICLEIRLRGGVALASGDLVRVTFLFHAPETILPWHCYGRNPTLVCHRNAGLSVLYGSRLRGESATKPGHQNGHQMITVT